MRCFASSCWLIVLGRAVAYNFHLSGINPENGEKSIFDLYSATVKLVVDKPTGSAITSVIVDDIDAGAGAGASIQTPQLVGGLRTQSRLNLSVPFRATDSVRVICPFVPEFLQHGRRRCSPPRPQALVPRLNSFILLPQIYTPLRPPNKAST